MKFIKDIQFLFVYNFLLVSLKIEYLRLKIKNRKNTNGRLYVPRVN